MRVGKILGVALVVLDFLTPAGPGFFQGQSHEARASSVPLLTGPQDTSQMNATINGVIINLNAILSPLTGGGLITGSPSGSGIPAVNTITLIPAATGSPAIIGIAPGGDANASIQINPNGTGNIVLFAGVGDTGVIQIANATGWYPAKSAGVVACPGGGAGASLSGNLAAGLLPGGAQTIAGYEVHEDWLGRAYWVPGCR